MSIKKTLLFLLAVIAVSAVGTYDSKTKQWSGRD